MSSKVQLFVGFTVSGIIHVGGDLMLDPNYAGYSIPFFIYQAMIITLEDFLIERLKQLGFRDGRPARAVGYIWTAGWWLYTAPCLWDWHLKRGIASHWVMRVSVVRPLLNNVANWTGVDVVKWIVKECQM